MQTKRCSKCGEVKPLIQFNKKKASKDGHRAQCKACQNSYQSAYQKTTAGKDLNKAKQARYRAKQTPAIYKITCLKNGRSYIGSSVAPKSRQTEHWSDLKQGRHKTLGLQEDYNLYGREAFTFAILQEASESDLRAIEQRYIDANPNGYNLQDALAY